jgi:hypothetical protein
MVAANSFLDKHVSRFDCLEDKPQIHRQKNGERVIIQLQCII